jgi:hypothetical protein
MTTIDKFIDRIFAQFPSSASRQRPSKRLIIRLLATRNFLFLCHEPRHFSNNIEHDTDSPIVRQPTKNMRSKHLHFYAFDLFPVEHSFVLRAMTQFYEMIWVICCLLMMKRWRGGGYRRRWPARFGEATIERGQYRFKLL